SRITQRGDRMSITLLPEEIFLQIVEILVLPYNDQRAPRLNTLRLVCRRWDETIQQTPSLWTYIWNGTKNTYVEQALLRSGTLGLKVRVSHWKAVKNQDEEGFWSALLPHVSRWEHAELSGKIEDNVLQALAHRPAPRLRSLALSSREPHAPDGFFPWPVPNLESLRIRNFGFPWDPQQFPPAGLKHLYINLNRHAISRAFRHELKLVQMFDCLRGCQELLSLHLTGIAFLWEIPEEKLTEISLPKLEVISIGACPRPIECKLLETIHIPKCKLIVLRPWYWGSTASQIFRALENLASRVVTTRIPNRAIIDAQDSTYETHLGCDLRAVDGGSSFMRLRLEIRGDPPYDALLERARPFLDNWISFFGPNTGVDVRVTSCYLETLASMLLAFATHFPMALGLTITHWFTNPDWPPNDPLGALHDGTSGLAFPSLERLELWHCNAFAGGISRIIRERVIIENALGNSVTPLCMRIKVTKDMEVVERVELAWLEDQLPNLTIEETDVILGESDSAWNHFEDSAEEDTDDDDSPE
ncbi:hypothetical protein FRC01_008739, partial [Tulasnella sp. 417]